MPQLTVLTVLASMAALGALAQSGGTALDQCQPPTSSYLMTNTPYTAVATLSPSSAIRTQKCAVGSNVYYGILGTPNYWSVNQLTGAVAFAGMSTQGTASATVTAYCGGFASPMCASTFAIVVAAPLSTSAPTPAPPTTPVPTTPAPPVVTTPANLATPCIPVYGYDVYCSQTYTDSLAAAAGGTACPIGSTTTYSLLQGPSTTAALNLNPSGAFTYVAPPTPNFDRFRFAINCNGAPICSATAYIAIDRMLTTPPPPPPPTPAPMVTIAPLQLCDNIYFFQARQYTPPTTSASVRLMSLLDPPTKRPCDVNAMSFALVTPPKSTANFTLMAFGPFLFAPLSTLGWDNFTFVANCASDATTGGNPWSCTGTANILTTAYVTAAPGQTLPPETPAPQMFVPKAKLTCTGTCNERAWVTAEYTRDQWDNSPSSSYMRADGLPVDYTTITFVAGTVLITALGAIGNMAARYPTFEPLPPLNAILAPSSLRGVVNADNLPFDETCLANQPRFGAGEQVWWWTNFSGLQGHVGELYRSGKSYYQKYGGKHVSCDTFLDPCNYAPLLNPKGPWYLAVTDCDTRWSASFNRTALLNLTKANSDPVFTRDTRPQFDSLHASRPVIVARATLYNEAVKPVSWVIPTRGFTSRDSKTDLDAVIEENIRVWFVGSSNATAVFSATTTVAPRATTAAPKGSSVAPPPPTTTAAASAAPFSVQATSWVNGAIERFTYIGSDGGLWMGYNVLMLPREPDVTKAPVITGILLSEVVWSPQTVSMCGRDCAARYTPALMHCIAGVNKTLVPNTTDCLTDWTLLPIVPGPTSTAPCKTTKPFSPAGIAGLSDTSCNAAGSQIARSANITLRVRLGDATIGNVMPYFPEGDITFAIQEQVKADNGQLYTTQESFVLRLSSNLVGVATVDTGNLVHGSADVTVNLCRAVLWPANPHKDPTKDVPLANETCLAMNERSLGVEDYAVLVFAGVLATATTAAPVVTNPPTSASGRRLQQVNSTTTASTTQGTAAASGASNSTAAPPPAISILYAVAFAGATTAAALSSTPVTLINDTISAMPFALQKIALPPAYGTFLNVRRNLPSVAGDVTFGFSPGTLCATTGSQCVVLVEAAFLMVQTGETVTVRTPIVVDPLLTNEARTGVSRVMASFFSVMFREDGIPPNLILPTASQFSVLVSVILCFLLLIMGSVHIYTTKNSREVFDEHQKVLKSYLIRVGAIIPGVSYLTRSSRPAPAASSPAAASPAASVASPSPAAGGAVKRGSTPSPAARTAQQGHAMRGLPKELADKLAPPKQPGRASPATRAA